MHDIYCLLWTSRATGLVLGWTRLYAHYALFSFSFLFGAHLCTCMAVIILMFLVPVSIHAFILTLPRCTSFSFFGFHGSFTSQASTTTFSLTTISRQASSCLRVPGGLYVVAGRLNPEVAGRNPKDVVDGGGLAGGSVVGVLAEDGIGIVLRGVEFG